MGFFLGKRIEQIALRAWRQFSHVGEDAPKGMLILARAFDGPAVGVEDRL